MMLMLEHTLNPKSGREDNVQIQKKNSRGNAELIPYHVSDANAGIPAGISNYGNSESGPFIISSGNSVNPSPFPHTLRSEPSGIRNPEFDCSLSGASIQVLHDVPGIRNPETGLSLLHRPRGRSESGIRNLKSLVQPETNARI